MKAILLSTSLVLAFAGAGVGFTTPAMAAGCIKGAIVGGLAGHLVHHGVLGAAAGCTVGRVNANHRIAEENRAYEPGPGYNPNVPGYQQPQPPNGSNYDRY